MKIKQNKKKIKYKSNQIKTNKTKDKANTPSTSCRGFNSEK